MTDTDNPGVTGRRTSREARQQYAGAMVAIRRIFRTADLSDQTAADLREIRAALGALMNELDEEAPAHAVVGVTTGAVHPSTEPTVAGRPS